MSDWIAYNGDTCFVSPDTALYESRLRDEIAIASLSSLISNCWSDVVRAASTEQTVSEMPEIAYKFADRMLAERKKRAEVSDE